MSRCTSSKSEKSHDANKIFFEDLEDNNDDDEKEENHKDNKNEDCWQVPLKCNEIDCQLSLKLVDIHLSKAMPTMRMVDNYLSKAMKFIANYLWSWMTITFQRQWGWSTITFQRQCQQWGKSDKWEQLLSEGGEGEGTGKHIWGGFASFFFFKYSSNYIIYCGIILGLHWLDTSRVIDILDNPSSIFFLTVPQTLRTRDIWIHFFFWDRQHRNKSSQKSKIRTKSTSRFDCYFPIYKWQKTNYQG